MKKGAEAVDTVATKAATAGAQSKVLANLLT